MITKFIIALLLFFNIQIEQPHSVDVPTKGQTQTEKTIGTTDLWP